MLQDGHFVFLFYGQLHFSNLEGLFKLVRLRLKLLPPPLFLSPRLITLIQITTQILYLLLLLPEYLTELVGGVPHVLEHIS